MPPLLHDIYDFLSSPWRGIQAILRYGPWSLRNTHWFTWCVWPRAILRNMVTISRVDFFINLLPKKIRNYVEIFNYFCIVLLSITLTYYGVRLSLRSYGFNVLSPTPLRVPLFWLQSILPVGMAMMSVKSLLRFLSLGRIMLFRKAA
jgi:hypothetical protein